MTGQITIKNRSKNLTEIDIEGVIGVPEERQFEQDDSKIATYQKFKTALLEMRDIKTTKIVINIRSIGGNVCDALLIHDTLATLNADVTTRCFGYVASAATIIAQTASPGKRLISQNALYLIHKSTSTAEGNSTEIAQTIGLLDKTDERIAEIYAKRADKECQTFVELMNENSGNGRWLTPEECLEAGLADRIIAPGEISNQIIDMAQVMNLPKLPQPESENNSSILKAWTRIRELIRITPETQNQSSKEVLDAIDHQLEVRREQIVRAQSNDSEPESKTQIEPDGVENCVEIEALNNKIFELEAQNAKLKAAKTPTLPKEDPAPEACEITQRSNKSAYLQDLNNLIDR